MELCNNRFKPYYCRQETGDALLHLGKWFPLHHHNKNTSHWEACNCKSYSTKLNKNDQISLICFVKECTAYHIPNFSMASFHCINLAIIN